MSLLNTTILDLSRQGFFCIPLVNGSSKKNYAFANKDRRKGIPSVADYKTKCTSPETFQKLFKINDNFDSWESEVNAIAIVAGKNGVLGFDFDIKHFYPKKDKETGEIKCDPTKYHEAWKIWNAFKAHLKVNNIPYHLDRTKSGGEHVIILCELNLGNLEPEGDICPCLGVEFIECFANRKALSQSITISPSEGYKQLSSLSLTDLPRINAEQRKVACSYFESFIKKEKKRVAEERKRAAEEKKKLAAEKPKKEKQDYQPCYTETEMWERINSDYGNDASVLAERWGYTRRGNRLAKPSKENSHETDLLISSCGKKVKCFAKADILYNNGKPCDCVDILVLLCGRNRSELYIEGLKKHSPHQLTKRVLNAETEEELMSAITETCKDRIVMNVYETPDKSEIILDVKTSDGSTKLFDLDEFLGSKLEKTAATFFSEDKYFTNHVQFSPLKRRILLEKNAAQKKLLLEHACWHEGRFCYKSSDECHIKTDYFDDSGHSFEEWKTQVFDVAAKKSGTAIALLMGFAAPFSDILHKSFGINLVGGSNMGKSSSVRITRGMFSKPKMLETWESTVSALEAKRYMYANRVMCIDDMHKADCKTLTAITRIMGETHRDRAGWDGKNLTLPKSYSVPSLVMSSSEHSFSDVAKRLQVPIAKGDINRFLDFLVTKEDFLDEKTGTKLGKKVATIYGVAIARLCERMEYLNEDSLVNQFNEFSEQYDTEVDKVPAALKRVLRHRIFLEFVAKLTQEILGIDTKEMMANAKILFDRFVVENEEILEDGDSIELNSVKEKLLLMLASGKHICSNDPEDKHRANDDTCFFTSQDTVYCYPPKLVSIMTRDLNLSSKQVWSALKTLDVLWRRVNIPIISLNRTLNVYSMKDLNQLDPDTTQVQYE